jgi:hypothetical protein
MEPLFSAHPIPAMNYASERPVPGPPLLRGILLRNTKAHRKAAGLASRRCDPHRRSTIADSAQTRALDAHAAIGGLVKTLLVSIATTFALVLAMAAHAAPPSGAPAGTTGLCKDGSWYSGATRKGACRGHKGVKEWYAADDASATTSAPTSTESKKKSTESKKTKKQRETSAAETAPSTASTSPAPAGATGLCKDGTYYSGENKRGACRGHQGVKEWYGAAAPTKAATPTATPASTPKSTPAPLSTPVPPVAKAPASSGTMSSPSRSMPSSPVPGGGNGKVWVNTSSKVYHCAGDRYYGTTKTGEYMSESDAVSKGNRPAHGKGFAS